MITVPLFEIFCAFPYICLAGLECIDWVDLNLIFYMKTLTHYYAITKTHKLDSVITADSL